MTNSLPFIIAQYVVVTALGLAAAFAPMWYLLTVLDHLAGG